MKSFNNVIGIHGVPRSGTSWLAQIFNSEPSVRLKFQPLFSYAFKNTLNEDSKLEDINKFYEGIWKNDSDLLLNMNDPDIHKSYPKFEKNKLESVLVFKQVHHHYILSRLLSEDKNLKLILMIRNPLSVLASWKNAPREFNPEWSFTEEWRYANKKNQGLKENYFGFDKWKKVSKLFISLSESFPERVYLLEYGELLKETNLVIKKLFVFTGLGQLSEQTQSFISKSKVLNHNDPNSVFKNKVDDNNWVDLLPENVIKELTKDELFLELNGEYNWL